MKRIIFTYILVSFTTIHSFAQESSFVQTEVIYGRKDGMALTMKIVKPKEKPNGKSIVYIISGGYYSSVEWWNIDRAKPYLENGYTVFAVAHGSQPRYTVPDALSDVQRAVRYIKHHAKDFAIDPGKIGVRGSSAGGHLALLIGLMDGKGNLQSKDNIDRLSSKVQAVVCVAPPSDFLNWSSPGDNFVYNGLLQKYSRFKPPFEFKQWDTTSFNYVLIRDTSAINKILSEISPVNHVSPDDPPVLIIHGDQDDLIPIQQSGRLIAKLQQQKIPSELISIKGGTHDQIPEGPKTTEQIFLEWFDKHLK